MQRAEAIKEIHRGKARTFARLLPVVRPFTPIVADAANIRYPRFALINIAGGFLWAVGMAVGGYFLGSAIPNGGRYFLLPVMLMIGISVALTMVVGGVRTAARSTLWYESGSVDRRRVAETLIAFNGRFRGLSNPA